MKTLSERAKLFVSLGTEAVIALGSLGFILNKAANDEPQNAVAGIGFGFIAMVGAGFALGAMSNPNNQDATHENVRSMTQRDGI